MDIWALGCLAYELLGSSSPFNAPTEEMVKMRILRNARPSLAVLGAPPDACAFIEARARAPVQLPRMHARRQRRSAAAGVLAAAA